MGSCFVNWSRLPTTNQQITFTVDDASFCFAYMHLFDSLLVVSSFNDPSPQDSSIARFILNNIIYVLPIHSFRLFLQRLFKSTTTTQRRSRLYTVSEFQAEAPQATASELLAQGPCVGQSNVLIKPKPPI